MGVRIDCRESRVTHYDILTGEVRLQAWYDVWIDGSHRDLYVVSTLPDAEAARRQQDAMARKAAEHPEQVKTLPFRLEEG